MCVILIQRRIVPMIDLHYWSTPNGHKITMFLEETGLEYKVFPVQIGKGDQFKPEFLQIAPNNRIPAIVDNAPKGGGKPLQIFESGAILLYLAEKTGQFLPQDLYGRYDAIQWSFWQMGGLGPMPVSWTISHCSASYRFTGSLGRNCPVFSAR